MNLITLKDKYEYFNKIGFITSFVDIKLDENNNKKPTFIGKYKNLEKSKKFTSKYSNFLCMHKDIILIDLDVKDDVNGIKTLNDGGFHFMNYNAIITKSLRGGRHIYLKHTDYSKKYLKTATNIKSGIDIKTNIKELNCGGFEGTGYEIIKSVNSFDELEYINDDLVNFLIQKEPELDSNISTQSETESYTSNTSDNFICHKYYVLLNFLPNSYFNDYDKWMKPAYALYYSNDICKETAFNIWISLLQEKSKKYNYNEALNCWDNIKTDIDTKFRMASIKQLVNDYNEVNYKNWVDVYDNDELEFKDEKKLLSTALMDYDVAEYFMKKYDTFKVYDNELYYYNGIKWVNRGVNIHCINNILSTDLYFKLNTFICKFVKDDNDKFVSYQQKILKLKSHSAITNMVKAIYTKITIYDDIFDRNENLICFNNGTYDLKNDIFRDNDINDYITKNIPYDYKFLDDDNEDMILLSKYFEKILPEKEKRDLLLLLLSTTLYSMTLEKFIILTGAGGNGKDTIFSYLMPKVLGDLYYEGNTNCITTLPKGDLNVAMANCHKKNMIIFNEPSDKLKIITSEVKKLTGCKNINCRTLYSTKTETKLNCTIFMLANDLPLLDKVDEAMERRLIVIKFNTLFKEKSKLIDLEVKEGLNDDGNYYYEANPYFKSNDFIEKVKLPMMNLLLKYFKTFKNDNYLIEKIPQSVKNENKKYMTESSDFISWFNSEFVKTDNNDEVLKLGDVYVENYKPSYLYENLTKQQKRTYTRSWFIDHIKKNIYLKRNFYDRKNINGKYYRNVLVGYKKIENEDDEYDDLEFE